MTKLLETDLYRLIDCRHGRFLINPNDRYMGQSMLTYGEYSELEWTLLDQLVPKNGIVIEAGANMGTFTVPLAKKAGANGLVYAFEPQTILFQQLCANLALNDLVNVQACNAGCGAKEEWLPVVRLNPATVNNFGGVSLELLSGKSQTRVRVERLDDALDPPRLDLIKADVEGMELDVLQGAAELIAKFRPTLYLEAHDDDAPALITHLQELEYDLHWHLPPMYNPANHFGEAKNIFGQIISFNMLATPTERAVNVNGARKVAGPDDHPKHWGEPGDLIR
ncbi:MAG: FkbM family methyltransferase [Pseudomonadota bacterium]